MVDTMVKIVVEGGIREVESERWDFRGGGGTYHVAGSRLDSWFASWTGTCVLG